MGLEPRPPGPHNTARTLCSAWLRSIERPEGRLVIHRRFAQLGTTVGTTWPTPTIPAVKCPHCNDAFHESWQRATVGGEDRMRDSGTRSGSPARVAIASSSGSSEGSWTRSSARSKSTSSTRSFIPKPARDLFRPRSPANTAMTSPRPARFSTSVPRLVLP